MIESLVEESDGGWNLVFGFRFPDLSSPFSLAALAIKLRQAGPIMGTGLASLAPPKLHEICSLDQRS